MRFLIDVNLHSDLARAIRQQGIEARHVADFRMTFDPDPAIWRFACREQWTVVTKDADFARLRGVVSPAEGKLLWLRCGNVRRSALFALVLPRIGDVAKRFAAGETLIEMA